MDDILVIKLGALGDVVLSEGALRDIREHHPGQRITILTGPPYRRLLERCPWVDRVWTDPRAPRLRLDRMWQLRRRLHEAGFGMVYDLQNSGRTHFYYRYLFPRVAWSGTMPGCSHQYVPEPSERGTAPLVAQLRSAGIAARHASRPQLDWMAGDASGHLERAGVEPPFVTLIPGSSARNRDKRWPHFAGLAHRLRERGYTPVTVPGPDEIDEAIALPAVALFDAEGRCLDLLDLAGVLKRTALVVGNDTGPTHIAAFLGVPGVALFGTHVSHIRPALRDAGFGILEDRDLANITVDQVLAALPCGPAPTAQCDSADQREGEPRMASSRSGR
jgi:ADP-heptose:LPS heptosyltransferase